MEEARYQSSFSFFYNPVGGNFGKTEEQAIIQVSIEDFLLFETKMPSYFLEESLSVSLFRVLHILLMAR
ncbi:hypothetical protein KBT16_13280 [Nostoc sp. CCCryo 231-06]|nr:hypothetical protein [Nostoc sp. CCCryo 231-06]